MSTTTPPDPKGHALPLDHISDFRLSLARAHTPSGQHPEEVWWSVLITLTETSIDAFAKAAEEAYPDTLLVPAAYDAADRSAKPKTQPVTVFAREPLIKAMDAHSNPFGVSMVHLGAQTPVETLDFHAKPPSLDPILVCEDTVVMAVIDEGIAIGHDLFRAGPTASRVAHATILDSTPLTNGTSSVGRALDTEAINLALDECTFGGLLDEDLLYAQLGLVNWTSDAVSPVAKRVSHGTHVAALAAGGPIDKTCNPDSKRKNRPLICVSLPTRAIEDTTGLDLLPLLYLSFQILMKQAQRFRYGEHGPLAPVVFNLSFGNAGGPHDGTGLFAMLFEHYFGKQSKSSDQPAQKIWLTLPAGNMNLKRMHAVAQGPEPTLLNLTVLPNDRTPSVVQMWLPTSKAQDTEADITVTVTSPSGDVLTIPSYPGKADPPRKDDCPVAARLACDFDQAPTRRLRISLSLAPTEHLCGKGPIAPCGTWQIKITPRKGFAETVDVWIRRDETLPGTRSGGRQAVFEDDRYRRFDRFGMPLAVDPPDTDSQIRRSGTISGFACGETPIAVAAFTEKEAQVSSYSGSGPIAHRDLPPLVNRDGPDITAKGDDSLVLRGVLSAGSRSGSWVRLSGTSMAAPRVARAASEGIKDWTGSAREWSAHEAQLRPFPLQDPNPERAGAGGVSIPVKCMTNNTF